MTAHIDRLVVENFGCIKHAELKLTPLHAVIGPNDSGKSTLVAALGTALDVAAGGAFHRLVQPGTRIEARLGEFALALSRRVDPEAHLLRGSVRFSTRSGPDAAWIPRALEPLGGPSIALSRGARFVRLDPRRLRLSSSLVPHGESIRIDEHGWPLAGIVDAIATRDIDAFVALREDVRRLFPTVDQISLRNINASAKELNATLKDGTVIAAEALSDGLLYYIAFRSLAFLEPASAILIEEPENGLHPSRIADVIRILREISKTQLVLMATHSPLVINELQPDEVSVVTRTLEQGTKVTPIASTPNFEERSKIYALGELWLSYANGKDEAPLLETPKEPRSAAE